MNVYSVKLPQRTQGATASPIRARFLLPDGTVVDLTGATITATKKNINTDSLVTIVTGTLAPDTGQEADGWFNWDLSDDDVGEAGLFLVQFKATGGVAFDATSQGEWYLHPLQDAQAAAAPYLTGVTAAQKCALDNANAPSCANPFATVADVSAFVPDAPSDGDTYGRKDAAWQLLGSAALADAADLMPVIDPAVAGNLAVQTAAGELVDAGYAATSNGFVANTVALRDANGILRANGFVSSTLNGNTVSSSFNTWGIDAQTGVHRFLSGTADANRLAQTNEVQAVSFGGAQTITAPQQVQARANINAETAGAAATVQGNLNTHTGLTGTAVHGLGTASTLTSGATGAALVGAATVDAARGTLGITPVALPNITINHNVLTWTTSNIVGSAAMFSTVNSYVTGRTGTTPNSSGSFRVNENSLGLNYTERGVNFAKAINIWTYVNVFPNPEGVFYWTLGKDSAAAYGLVASGNYIGWRVENTTLTGLVVCVANTVTITPVSVAIPTAGLQIFIQSNNGAVNWYANGVLVGSTGAGPTANRLGTIFIDVNNGATAANYFAIARSHSEGAG